MFCRFCGRQAGEGGGLLIIRFPTTAPLAAASPDSQFHFRATISIQLVFKHPFQGTMYIMYFKFSVCKCDCGQLVSLPLKRGVWPTVVKGRAALPSVSFVIATARVGKRCHLAQCWKNSLKILPTIIFGQCCHRAFQMWNLSTSPDKVANQATNQTLQIRMMSGQLYLFCICFAFVLYLFWICFVFVSYLFRICFVFVLFCICFVFGLYLL